MQPLRKFNNLEERSIEALNAKCRSGRKIRLPVFSLVAGNTPLTGFFQVHCQKFCSMGSLDQTLRPEYEWQ